MRQGWGELPSAVFMPMLPLLTSMEVKTMRKVCRNWRQDVDAAVTHLAPRSLSLSAVLPPAFQKDSHPCDNMLDSSSAEIFRAHFS